jgi:hypothetical protein
MLPTRIDTLRSVWHFNRVPFLGGSVGWELDERMAYYDTMVGKWDRQRRGWRGRALDSIFLWNLMILR